MRLQQTLLPKEPELATFRFSSNGNSVTLCKCQEINICIFQVYEYKSKFHPYKIPNLNLLPCLASQAFGTLGFETNWVLDKGDKDEDTDNGDDDEEDDGNESMASMHSN